MIDPTETDPQESLGLSIDMLDVDRLRLWAERFEVYGPNVTEWGSTPFVIEKLRAIADGMATAIKDIGTLRAARASDAAAHAATKASINGDCHICHHDAIAQQICSQCRDCQQCKIAKLTAERDSLKVEQRRWSMTYGELPEALRLIVVPHEWDNKNISEQRDYAVARWSEIETQIDSLKAEHAELVDGVAFVVEKFKQSEAAGYRSRDRQFAIEVLSAAISSSQAQEP